LSGREVAIAAGLAPVRHPDLIVRNNQDINLTNASLGLKFRVAGRFVVTGNVLLKLDDGGLRSKAIPLVGASYSF
jgi:hypothetical protein